MVLEGTGEQPATDASAEVQESEPAAAETDESPAAGSPPAEGAETAAEGGEEAAVSAQGPAAADAREAEAAAPAVAEVGLDQHSYLCGFGVRFRPLKGQMPTLDQGFPDMNLCASR